MASFFGFFYALLQAIPVLDKAIREFLVYYAEKQIEWFNAEVRTAVDKAIATGETADEERSIGSPRAGKPSGDADSEFSRVDKP